MSFSMKTIAVIGVGFVLSTTSAFAQVGGSDIPSDAKAKGTMQNGPSSTGMSKQEAGQRMGMDKNAMKTKRGTMPKGQM